MSYVRDGAVDEKFARLMVVLAEVLGVRITEARVRAYASLLGDVPFPQLQAAFRAAANVQRGGCFPSPAELRANIGPVPGDAALLAWTALDSAAREHGAYASVEVEDGAAADALEATFGSWADFCELAEGPALALKRQEFMAAYRAAARRPQQARRLAGRLEGGGQYARHGWIGRVLADGRVLAVRDARQLEGGHGGERTALPEAGEGVAQAGEGARQADGDGADQVGAGAGEGAGRILPPADGGGAGDES